MPDSTMPVNDTELTAAKPAMPPAKREDKSDDDLLSIARKRLNIAMGATSDSREDELEDLKFAAGSSDNDWQWDAGAKATRTSPEEGVAIRPMLTINMIPQHIKQITNDQQQNRPTGKVVAVNNDADVAVAEIFDGIVRHIEYISDADVSYDTACESQTTIGEGYWRLLTDYADENSFDQDIFIRRIRNAFTVHLDPAIQDPCGQDARWGFIIQKMTKDEFEGEYPDATPISSVISNFTDSDWIGEDSVTVAEYFYVDVWYETLHLFPDNKTAFEGTPEYTVYMRLHKKPTKSRRAKREQVKWLKLNGYEVLERGDWAGKYIPIIKVVGNEFEIEGKVYTSGIVRNSKDPQRMYNYWSSNEVEMLALAPKAPFVGYSGQFEGYEKKWSTANTVAHPYLEVNSEVFDGNGNPLPLPQRMMPPMAQQGIIAAKQAAAEDIKKTTGQYNASLGQQGNERSAKAIVARQHEGDVSTYHYGANLARAVRYSTRQLVQLIPLIYDTQRVARIIGEDGNESMVHLDPNQKTPIVHEVDPENPKVIIRKIYNLNVGKYDVAVTTGPGYATKREAALDAMVQLLQGNPGLWAMAGDLIVKNMDWPGAQQLSKRLAKSIDPKLTADEDTSPALQQATQQVQQLTQELQQATTMLHNIHDSVESKELAIKQFDSQIKAYDAETKRIAATSQAANAAAHDKALTTPEQIQEVVLGTIHAAVASGHLMGTLPPVAPPVDAPQGPPQPPQQPDPMQGQQPQ
jgi:hypothetical protein